MDKELIRILKSFIPGFILVSVLWGVKLLEMQSGFLLTEYGVFPRTVSGLKGVITSPFIHGDFKHLISNSLPMLVLVAGVVYFYKSLALRVFLGVYILGGFWLWLGGRESYHIGASGLVYGLTSFLFFSGMFRRDVRLMALSMLVVFLYGGMIWGIFPLFTGVSWEAHLFGGLAGFLFAFFYRKEGPQRKVYEWEEEAEEEVDEENAYWKVAPALIPVPEIESDVKVDDKEGQRKPVNIHYIYTPQNNSDTPPSVTPDEKN
ncbi:MAG: rhomboid family intramembrane serine protease [Bacteroidetes bacterium]|nr:rhomboid family intramembrane serine protease [Bacteroidota bacterium]